VFWGAACLQPVFWLVVSLLMVDVNVGSVEVELRELSVLRPREIETLAEAGVRRPRQLLRRLRDVEAGAALRRRLGWSDERLAAVARQAELFTFKGIGGSLGLLLERVGVRRVRDLARWDEEELHSRLLAELRGVRHSLRLDMVRVWVLASRDHG
ncbi:MAG: DUF4332 domain-containing protein, partial [Planctomycetota bacterium]|nr:DUF4332 domain-containing protein [Planctomycetota bacterium]